MKAPPRATNGPRPLGYLILRGIALPRTSLPHLPVPGVLSASSSSRREEAPKKGFPPPISPLSHLGQKKKKNKGDKIQPKLDLPRRESDPTLRMTFLIQIRHPSTILIVYSQSFLNFSFIAKEISSSVMRTSNIYV